MKTLFDEVEKEERAAKRKAYKRAYREKHREEHLAYMAQYYAANKDEAAKRWAAYSEKNREMLKQRSKRYYDKNHEKCLAYHRAYAKRQRAAKSPRYKANQRIYRAVKAGKLIRPTECDWCGVSCKPTAHHWSYAPEHWLDVSWLCRLHHNLADRCGGNLT